MTEQLESVLMSPRDNDDNTITHLAAEGGHVSVFKVSFCLLIYCLYDYSQCNIALFILRWGGGGGGGGREASNPYIHVQQNSITGMQ